VPRYISLRPRQSYWDASLEDDIHTADTITVIEDDDFRPTGLLDARGDSIYRTDKAPYIGFGNGDE